MTLILETMKLEFLLVLVQLKNHKLKQKLLKNFFFFVIKKNTIARLNKLKKIDSARIVLENDV